MGGCRCSYKTCKNVTKSIENLHFFHYPVKHRERCDIWIQNAVKPEFMHLPDDQLRNKVICGLHFEDKYFRNLQKKRLVHNAIPTLDTGCEQQITMIREVEILPTSVDGTTFTLQADHLQPGPSRNTEQKVMFKNGEAIDPIETESEVYTIDPSFIYQSFYDPNGCVFVESGCRTNGDGSDIVRRRVESVERTYQNVVKKQEIIDEDEDDDDEESEIEMSLSQQGKVHPFLFDQEETIIIESSSPPKKIKTENQKLNRSVLRRINLHAQEIANIKRSLAQSNVKLPKSGIIRALKGRVPDTLLGALSLHLNKRQDNLTSEENAFLNAMETISPSTHSALRNLGWFIPQDNIAPMEN